MLTHGLHTHRLGQAVRENLEGNIPCGPHRSDDGAIAVGQRRTHALHRRVLRRHIGRHLRERPTLNVNDKGRHRLGILGPILRVKTRPGHEKLQIAARRPHLIRPLPHVERIQILPQSSQNPDVLGRHPLIKQHRVTHRRIPASPTHDALKTQVKETRIDLRDRTPSTEQQTVAALTHLCQRTNR